MKQHIKDNSYNGTTTAYLRSRCLTESEINQIEGQIQHGVMGDKERKYLRIRKNKPAADIDFTIGAMKKYTNPFLDPSEPAAPSQGRKSKDFISTSRLQSLGTVSEL